MNVVIATPTTHRCGDQIQCSNKRYRQDCRKGHGQRETPFRSLHSSVFSQSGPTGFPLPLFLQPPAVPSAAAAVTAVTIGKLAAPASAKTVAACQILAAKRGRNAIETAKASFCFWHAVFFSSGQGTKEMACSARSFC